MCLDFLNNQLFVLISMKFAQENAGQNFKNKQKKLKFARVFECGPNSDMWPAKVTTTFFYAEDLIKNLKPKEKINKKFFVN